MKTFNIILLIALGFLLALPSSNAQSTTNDSKYMQNYAFWWDNAVKNVDYQGLFYQFKAIEIKNQKEFGPALIKFIQQRADKPWEHYSLAIYTLAKLGNVKDAEKAFNTLLSKDYHSKANSVTMIPIREKRQALEYMLELGMKPSAGSVEEIKKEIAFLIKNKFPALVIDLAVPMKLHGHEITKEQKTTLAELITNKWRNVRPVDLMISGLHPDWEKMWISMGTSFNPDGEILAQMSLLAANKDELRRISQLKLERPEHGDTYFDKSKPLFEASLGDKNAIKSLKDKMTAEQRHICNLAPDKLPDEILLQVMDTGSKQLSIIPETRLIAEVEKRGYKDAIREYVKHLEIVSSVDAIHGGKFPEEKIQAVWALSQYDVSKGLDALAKMFEKSPEDYYIATHITQFPMNSYFHINPDGWEKWFLENPETLAKAIKTVIEASNNPDKLKMSYDSLGPTSADQIYHDKNYAYGAMMFLPEDIFNKYFAKLDSKYFTSSAYLAGRYFRAKWADPDDQESFYKKYSLKSKKGKP